eukprot:gene9271-10874_t
MFDVESIVRSGHLGLLRDKIKRQCHLYMSDKAVEMIVKSVHDPHTFDLIYQTFMPRFTDGALVITAIRGGNLHAFKRLYAAVKKPVAMDRIFGEAFLSPNHDIVMYVADNIPMPPAAKGYTVDSNAITLAHLERYMYVRHKVPVNRLFEDYHEVRLCSKELFDATYLPVTDESRPRIIETITKMFVDNILVIYVHGQERPPSLAKLEFVDYLEHVLKACAIDEKEVAVINAVRIRAIMLTSTMTPVKETYLVMLGYINWMDKRHLRGTTHSAFQFMIEWNDLDLTPYLHEKFGFAGICATGSLAQVEAAHRLPLTANDVSPTMASKDIQVLRFLHQHNLAICSQNRLMKEDNVEIIKFIVETQTKPMRISRRFLFLKERIDALKYLATKEWVDVDAEDDAQLVEDGMDDEEPLDVTCKSLEMMQYLIDSNHNFDRVRVVARQQSDLPMIQLYHRHLISISELVSVQVSCRVMIEDACTLGLLSIVQHIHSIMPEKMENGTRRFTFIDMALSAGHMDIVRFILANRSERFQLWSWKTAAATDDLELLKYVHANSDKHYYCEALESANKYGRLHMVKYITSNYPVTDSDLSETIKECLDFDQHHVLSYLLSTHNHLTDISIITPLIETCLSLDHLGCLKVLLHHLPANHQQGPHLQEFLSSLPPVSSQ